jgi:hypothetical protein
MHGAYNVKLLYFTLISECCWFFLTYGINTAFYTWLLELRIYVVTPLE